MNDLRNVFPARIVRGALLRPDGVAVGLVGGGAPPWELRSLAGRAQAGADYHRLLLSLDAPIDVYTVDQPPNVDVAIATLRERPANHPLLDTVLNEMADYLTELSRQSGSRAKQVVWTVTAGAGERARNLDVGTLVRRSRPTPATASATAGDAALVQTIERARRLVDGLAQLGGAPPPRLLEAEEIARLLYQLADPVRAQRYPLGGTLRERVRRVVMTL